MFIAHNYILCNRNYSSILWVVSIVSSKLNNQDWVVTYFRTFRRIYFNSVEFIGLKSIASIAVIPNNENPLQRGRKKHKNNEKYQGRNLGIQGEDAYSQKQVCILFVTWAWCELAVFGNSIETNAVTTVVRVEPEQIGASFIRIIMDSR